MNDKLFICALIFASLAGCASTGNKAASRVDPASLSKEHFRSATSFKEDAQGAYANFSTENVVKENAASPEEFQSDYLFASVDKKHGNVGFVLIHMGTNKFWRTNANVSIETPQGTFTKVATVKGTKNECSGSDCWHLESVSLVIPESLVRAYAKRYENNRSETWKFKVFPSYEGEIPAGEMAGIMSRVDEYRQSLGLSSP